MTGVNNFMLYTIIRLVLAAAAAAIVYVMLNYARDNRKHTRRARILQSNSSITACTIAIFAALALSLNLIPVENLIIGFSTPEAAFKYNNSDEIMEINEYTDCALVIASTGDGKLTTHVLPKKDGKWKLETIYNRKQDVTTLNYCIVERLYVPNSNDCFIIVTHSTSGSIADNPTNVVDSHNTKFIAVTYPDMLTFYYGYVQDMDDNYNLHVDGKKISFK